jgi:ribonuclease BN (tRNA processing enzyme)
VSWEAKGVDFAADKSPFRLDGQMSFFAPSTAYDLKSQDERNARVFAPVGSMKVTIVGCGDAFGSGGRAHTCIRVDAAATTVLVDFGSGSMTAWQKLGFNSNDVDAIIISHLHGDHFGGLPAFLLHAQYLAGRRKPLLIVGPPGLKARLQDMLDLLFPGCSSVAWNFAWQVRELGGGREATVAGLNLKTFDVIHSPGSMPTGLRLSDGKHVFAYSGDTAWTETLNTIAAEADLFLCECSSGDEPVPNHLHWPQLKSKLGDFTAKRVAITHMGPSAIAKIPDMQAAGLIVASDGLSFDL